MKTYAFAAAGLVSIVLIALTIVLLVPGHRARAGADSGTPGADATAIPSFITDLASWQHNGENGRYYAPIIAGATPDQAGIGTVRTDTDCAPDAEGLSHCHNIIALPSGATFTIQDNHNMMVNRCLSPGEDVTVIPIAPGWVELFASAS